MAVYACGDLHGHLDGFFRIFLEPLISVEVNLHEGAYGFRVVLHLGGGGDQNAALMVGHHVVRGVHDLAEVVRHSAGGMGLPCDEAGDFTLLEEQRHIGNLHGHTTCPDAVFLEQLSHHGVLDRTSAGGTDALAFKILDRVNAIAHHQSRTFLVAATDDVELHALRVGDCDRSSTAAGKVQRAGSHFLHDVRATQEFVPIHSETGFFKHFALLHDHNGRMVQLVGDKVTDTDFLSFSIAGEAKRHQQSGGDGDSSFPTE